MALVGGIGSGKTTELLLTMDRLRRHEDAVNLFLDASEFTNFSETNPGALLAAIGLRLFGRIARRFGEPSEQVQSANATLRKLALGLPNGMTKSHIPTTAIMDFRYVLLG